MIRPVHQRDAPVVDPVESRDLLVVPAAGARVISTTACRPAHSSGISRLTGGYLSLT